MDTPLSSTKIKSVNITGKHHAYQIKKLLKSQDKSKSDAPVERKGIQKIIQYNDNIMCTGDNKEMTPCLFSHSYQLELINSIDIDNEPVKACYKVNYNGDNTLLSLLLSELSKKQSGYKRQDQTNKSLSKNPNIEPLITVNNIISLFVQSSLVCFYCSKSVYIFYRNSREPYQWTLDRIDNNRGHTLDNCVISCLSCNLQRRRINDKKFLFTKKLKLTKCGHQDDVHDQSC
ncbi:hypothetical protein OAA60_03355 [Porticoccaceae bacterium]|jgi:hypothetical protein|nr:hypothetical protein [Porticoccaceae bacterium]